MEDLKRLDRIVENILTEDEEARNNMFYLYYAVCKERNPSIINAKFSTVLKNPTEYGLKPFESVARCRRKIVERNPKLKGNDDVEGGRWSSKKDYEEYVKG